MLRAANRPAAFAYENLGRPGTVAQREEIDALHLTLVRFSNDVRLTLRPSQQEPGYFRLRVVFPVNATHSPDPFIELEATSMVFVEDMTRHSHQEIAAFLAERKIEVDLRADRGTPRITLSGPAESLPFALQLLAAWLWDPEGRNESMPPEPILVEQQVTRGINLFPGSMPRGASPPRKFFTRPQDPIHLVQWAAICLAGDLNPQIGQPGTREVPFVVPPRVTAMDWAYSHMLVAPIEVGIVGDFDADTVINVGAKSLGALKRRVAIKASRQVLGSPKKAARLEKSSSYFARGRTVSGVAWPLPGGEDPKQTAALAIASAIFEESWARAAQQSGAKTLESHLWVYRDPVQRNFGFITMVNEFSPPTARALTNTIIRAGAKFSETNIGPEDFERAREKLRNQRSIELSDNSWWLENVVWAAQTHPALLDEAKAHASVLDSVTIADVNSATKVFSSQLSTAVILNGTAAPEAPKK